jgi:hypothetical protein
MSESAILYGLADQLSDHAAHIRSRATRLSRASESVQWHSVAADVFRERARDNALAMLRAANGVDDAAAAMRAHARTVHEVERIAAAAIAVGGKVVDGVRGVGHTLTSWL